MMLKFKDGMEFDTSGEYRIESREDGLYVVGHGILCAVKDDEEGKQMMEDLKNEK